jgi:hypothetical protein
MKPVDMRNEKFEDIKDRLEGFRRDAYHAWIKHGPGTTRHVAAMAGIDILTFRPRTTELYQLGLVEMTNAEPGAGEGVYSGVPLAVAEARFNREKEKATSEQMSLL